MSKSNLFGGDDLISTSWLDRMFQSSGTRSTDVMLAEGPGAKFSSALTGVLPSPEVIWTMYFPGFSPDFLGTLYSPFLMGAPLLVSCCFLSTGSKMMIPSWRGSPTSFTFPETSIRPAYGSEHPARIMAAARTIKTAQGC